MPSDIKKWVFDNVRHSYYLDSVKYYNDLKENDLYEIPSKSLAERRPSESPKIKGYREKIYVSKNYGLLNKTFNAFQKIRKSSDYAIRFDDSKVPATIIKTETLKEYTVSRFPKFTSLDNWFWSVAAKEQWMDSNAVIFWDVINKDIKENEYYKPYPTIFNSPQIYDYREGEFYFLKSNESYYFVQDNKSYPGEIYYYIDNQNIERWYQTSLKREFAVYSWPHNLGYIPVVTMQGVADKDNLFNTLFRSRISPMIPDLKEVNRFYSDFQAVMVQHMHPKMWAVSGPECKTCSGTGKVAGITSGAKTKFVSCESCKGKGKLPLDPYEFMELSIKSLTEGGTGTIQVPAGQIPMDISPAKFQWDIIKETQYQAASSINHEKLLDVPLNISGVAKQVDRQEPYNFTYAIAEDAIRVIDSSFKIVCDYRYSIVVSDPEVRKELLPDIEVPTKYDLVSDVDIIDGIQKMRTANMNPNLIGSEEMEYVDKKMTVDDRTKKIMQLMVNLDPFYGVTEDVLTMQRGRNAIDETDDVIHSNIKKFVQQALAANKDFLILDFVKQQEIIEGYAETQISEIAGKVAEVTDLINAGSQAQKDLANNPV